MIEQECLLINNEFLNSVKALLAAQERLLEKFKRTGRTFTYKAAHTRGVRDTMKAICYCLENPTQHPQLVSALAEAMILSE